MSSDVFAAASGSFGRFEVLAAERRLLVDGKPVPLGSRAFDLLAALVARRERVVSKDELMDVVWPGLVVEDNNLQVQISALRKVLGAQAIATVAGRGYQFTVAAPAPGAAASPSPAEMPAPRVPARAGSSSPQGPARVLVADDNKVNRLLLCRSLELMGHAVASADNGRRALEMLRNDHFDLLLLDLEMPEIDGFGLLEQRAADAALREVPVIVTSSLEGAAAVARCIELGADDFLHKPVNPVLLKARVESSLERKRLRDRQRELLARLAPGWQDESPTQAGAPGTRVLATLVVARLHDLDVLAGVQPPQETLELLDHWTTLMLDAVEGRGGRLYRTTGDELAAVFGAALPFAEEGGAARAAVQAALEMLQLTAMFNAERSAMARPAIAAGIGIAAGEVVAGYAGLPGRAAFVCVGAAVQRADRLAAAAAAGNLGALLDAAVYAVLSAGPVPAGGTPPVVWPGSPKGMPAYSLKPA